MTEGFVGDVRVLLRGRERTVLGKHLQIHAGGEMLAGGRDHDDAGPRVIVDVADDGRQRAPELPVHGVELLRPIELQVRYAVPDGNVENVLRRARA